MMRAFKDLRLLSDNSGAFDVVIEDYFGDAGVAGMALIIRCVNEASADAILEALAEHSVNVEVVKR